jgi:hypothetical protein
VTNIKIKGLSLIILLTILIFSNTEVFADDGISNESLDKLKEKEHLYYEDFDALKTENSFIYQIVVDKYRKYLILLINCISICKFSK